MSRSVPERWPISSRRRVKSGISTRVRMRRRTLSAASASRRTGSAIVPASRIDSTTITRGGDQKDLEDGEPLGFDHVVDIGALRRQHQRAAHGAEALHRHRDRDDDVAAIVDAHHAGIRGRSAPARLRDSPCRSQRRVRDKAAGRRGRASGGPRDRRARIRPAFPRSAAAGRSAARRRGRTGCGCRPAARRRDRRCGRASWSAKSAGAGSARRARD